MCIDKVIEEVIVEVDRLHAELRKKTAFADELIAKKQKGIKERMIALNIANENMDAAQSVTKWELGK